MPRSDLPQANGLIASAAISLRVSADLNDTFCAQHLDVLERDPTSPLDPGPTV